MTQFKIGDRVKYVGNYMVNGDNPNTKQDLVPGYIGTVVGISDLREMPWPNSVKFDLHRETLIWLMADDEIDLVGPVKITNYNESYGLNDEYRALVLAEAEATSVKEAASKFNLNSSTIYYWRKAVKDYANA